MKQLSSDHLPASLFDDKILVVDDAAINRDLIVSYLSRAGYKNIITATDGKETLEKIKQEGPSLLILDLVMPNMDGTEVIKILRSQKSTQKLPILVQTTISDPEERKEAWGYGATDIITKPIHKLELLSRVKVHLQNNYLINALESYHKLANDEIGRALELQKTLLPSTDVVSEFYNKYGLNIQSLFVPSRFLSGDMWGIYEFAPNKIMVWIADFSGKGISASLSTFRLHTLFSEYKNKITSPIDLLNAINARLAEMIQIGHFCTCLIGMIDVERKTISYVSAGFTHPIIYYPAQKRFVLGDGAGMPLGIRGNMVYELRTLSFGEGATLILYSDLLWDDIGAIPGISFLPEKLPQFVAELNGNSFVKFIKSHIDTLDEKSFSDDLTLVEIKFEGRR